jgi:hypothetical protein
MTALLFVHPGRPTASNGFWRRGLLLLLSAVLFCSSCNQSKITIYRIPKESVGIETSSGSLVPAPPAMMPKWTVPSAWKEQPLTEMRLASFKAEGSGGQSADISVSSFPGDAGGIESNINRWRGQVHQAVLGPDSLAKTLDRVTIDGVPVVLVDVQTPEGEQKPDRIIGAVFRTADRTWFVKMTGAPAILQAQAENLKQFVNSFRFPNQPEASDESVGSGKAKSTNDK